MYSYSTPYFTRKTSLKYTRVKLNFITDDKLILLLENYMRGGPSFVLGNRQVKREEKKIACEDMTNPNVWNKSQYLPTGVIHEIEPTKRNERNFLETYLKTPAKSKCG